MAVVDAKDLTEEQLKSAVADALIGKDINSMSLKDLRRDLEKKFSLEELSMDVRKSEVQTLAVAELQRIAAADEAVQEKEKEKENADAAKPKREKRKREEQEGEERPPSKAMQANKDSGMTKKRFLAKADAITIPRGVINDKPIKIGVKEFSTGSSGWHTSSKAKIDVDGEELMCQVNIQLIVVGSKEWDK
eukprot:gnl/MRDRNA2_/MRDRNA2_87524_c0_seq1.p1 gnl/MRDRNA2_/MRDRNA2_87524_c0~~gnl/MRDRNA2_/MRDRNA2_87524_c0_seq1.p1  ORF type:complete len:191 (+),score=64.97 gnl/MRDRNA2_/MRDRNA2_87524_c0_seq1:102-674(+)